jgi:hypothetical protein
MIHFFGYIIFSHYIYHQQTHLTLFWKHINGYLVGGIPTPLKNDGLRQLGLLFPTEWKVIKFHGSKPPTSDD